MPYRPPIELNDRQHAAVTASLDPQLVLAGPGTGKTRVLVCRAAYLIEEVGWEGSEIALVTFTNKAARQLRERLADLVGAQAQHVRAGTLHHFCHSILRAHGDRIGFPDGFVVADDRAVEPFWRSWMDENQAWCGSQRIKSVTAMTTRVGCVKLGLEKARGPLRRGLEDYDAFLRSRNALDFTDVLTKARDLLKEDEVVRRALTQQLKAVLVDEFQDTDPVQFEVLDMLRQDGVHSYCVADEDQSIYAFRGATVDNVSRFIERTGCSPEAGTQHILEMNYRSNAAIYAVAESVLEQQARLKDRGAVRTLEQGGEPVLIQPYETEEDERAAALQLVQEWIEEGVDPSEIAVLAPWNSMVSELEAAFLRAGVPCEASNADDLLDTWAARQLRATLELAHRMPAAREQGAQLLDEPLRTLMELMLPTEAVSRVEHIYEQNGSNYWGILQAAARSAKQAAAIGLKAEREPVRRLVAVVTQLIEKAGGEGITLKTFLDAAIEQLDAPLGLLSERAQDLTDPLEVEGLGEAAEAIRETMERGGRVFAHHPDTTLQRLWTLMLRRALGVHDDWVPTKEALTPLAGAYPNAEPIGEADLVLTGDSRATSSLLNELGRQGYAEAQPAIVRMDAHDPLLFETERHLEVDPSRQIDSPSVRLFKLAQALHTPAPPVPLFDEYVMVDLETTSADPERCRVAEIGALRVVGGEVEERFESFVDPGELTADERRVLQEICQIDPATDLPGAPSIEEAFAEFAAFTGARPIVAHNGHGFDFRVLRRLQEKFPEADACWTARHDTLPDAVALYPHLRSHAAESLRKELLGDEHDTAHRALADCIDQQRILERMQEDRSAHRRRTALEQLTPVLAGALAVEGRNRSLRVTEELRALLEAGYHWAIRGAGPVTEGLDRLIGRGVVRAVQEVGSLRRIVNERNFASDGRVEPGLRGRLLALFAPYADEPLGEVLAECLTHLSFWGHERDREGARVVTISTYHSAKGLEFERVICQGVHAGAFPAYWAQTEEERRESRRLLYVGLTRAQHRLVVTYPTRGNRGQTSRPSPFLGAAPADYVRGGRPALTR